MPPKRHLDQEKRNRQNSKRRLRNVSAVAALKTLEKRVRAATPETRVGLLSEAYAAIDRAASKGILPGNTAARKKSRLTRALAR